MKKPDMPSDPYKWQYNQDWTEETILARNYISDEDFDEDEWVDNWKDMHDWKDGESIPAIPEACHYENTVCSLKDILDIIPADVPPENIEISFNRDRMFYDLSVTVTAKRPTDKIALQKSYNEALKEYKVKEVQYKKDLAEYQAWEKEQEILNLEKKLSELKK